MGIARSLVAMVTLGLITASCAPGSTATPSSAQMEPTPPADRPTTYGAPRSLGGPTYQWSLTITVDALSPDSSSWFSQPCTKSVEESTRRQTLFTNRLDVALDRILTRNAHCTISALSITHARQVWLDPPASPHGGPMSLPSGAIVVLPCGGNEPLIKPEAPTPGVPH